MVISAITYRPFKFDERNTQHLIDWMERGWASDERDAGIRTYDVRNGIQVIEEIPSVLHPNARVYHVRDVHRRQSHAISCKLVPDEVSAYVNAVFTGATFAELNQKYNPPRRVIKPDYHSDYGSW